jgi:cell wall-associated NlpC family hydrolase
MPDKFTVDDSAVRVLRTETAAALQLVATNLTDLHKGPSFLDEMATQVTNGTVLELLEQRDKWSFVRQTDGYLGWVYSGFLAPASTAAAKATHLVTLPSIDVRAEPDMSAHPITRIPIGSAVHADATNTSWARVQFAGGMLPAGWVHGGGLREMKQFPLTIAETREQIVADARRLTGCYYLWGGNTAWGLDCSGLAGLCHRLSGYTLPRDADMQFISGHTIDGDQFEAGDLFFFWNDAKTKIGHVGIATGEGWNMIHSSRARNGVYEEDVQKSQSLKASYAGARSYIGRE